MSGEGWKRHLAERGRSCGCRTSFIDGAPVVDPECPWGQSAVLSVPGPRRATGRESIYLMRLIDRWPAWKRQEWDRRQDAAEAAGKRWTPAVAAKAYQQIEKMKEPVK